MFFRILGLFFSTIVGKKISFSRRFPNKRELVDLEKVAYTHAGIASNVEGYNFFQDMNRGVGNAKIKHFSIFYQSRLISYFCYFINGKGQLLFKYPEQISFRLDRGLSSVTFSKLLRHPGDKQRNLLYRYGLLRVLLIISVLEIYLTNRNGFYLEVQAQWGTKRLLREGGVLDRVMPGVHRIYEEEVAEGVYNLLLLFPNLSFDLVIASLLGIVSLFGGSKYKTA